MKVENLFEDGAKKKSAAKKEHPVITGCEAVADKLHKAIRNKKDLEAEIALLEAKVLEVSNEEYERDAKGLNYQSSFNIPGKTTPGLMAVYTNKFSKIGVDQEAVLKEDPKFEDHFVENREVSLKDPSDEMIQKIVKAVGGPKKFQEMFEAKRSYKPANATVQFIVADNIRRLCKQAKPSIKLK